MNGSKGKIRRDTNGTKGFFKGSNNNDEWCNEVSNTKLRRTWFSVVFLSFSFVLTQLSFPSHGPIIFLRTNSCPFVFLRRSCGIYIERIYLHSWIFIFWFMLLRNLVTTRGCLCDIYQLCDCVIYINCAIIYLYI